jgi:hypothetical protein
MSDTAGARERKYSIVLYSDDVTVRETVMGALGSRVSPEMAEHVIHQFATAAALRLFVDGKRADSDTPIDLFILDGESVPEGGIGMARPVMVITGRKEDAWLAAWSRAEANVLHPVDPFTLSHTVADLLRARTIATNATA